MIFSFISHELRVIKKRLALALAIADICKVWELDQITSKLTEFADASLSIAFDVASREVFEELKKSNTKINLIFPIVVVRRI